MLMDRAVMGAFLGADRAGDGAGFDGGDQHFETCAGAPRGNGGDGGAQIGTIEIAPDALALGFDIGFGQTRVRANDAGLPAGIDLRHTLD